VLKEGVDVDVNYQQPDFGATALHFAAVPYLSC
jgi:hypothetical protein